MASGAAGRGKRWALPASSLPGWTSALQLLLGRIVMQNITYGLRLYNVAWSICVCVCVFVGHDSEPYKND